MSAQKVALQGTAFNNHLQDRVQRKMVPGRIYEEGQFDDAQEDTQNGVAAATPHAITTGAVIEGRGDASYVDDPDLFEWSEDEELDEEEDEDEVREEDFYDNRAEDEDWDVTERDFTKQFNRLRQHVAVHSGAAEGTQQATAKSTSAVAVLPPVNRPRKTATTAVTSPLKYQDKKMNDQLASLSKYASRLKHIDEPYKMGMGASVNRKGPSAHANMKDKADRATTEQVLDPRTRIILYKMIGRGLIQEINGCVSTGKEANVYHALSPEGKHLALKIYKTSILIFKDRDRYVAGEHRFRQGYSRHNPRKMVRMWAEKEMRNLKRLATTGVPCPAPVDVRESVLVMEFLGDEEGWASPRLKDAEVPETEYPKLYQDLVLTVRRLFHDCRLVHADLSEYNILYHASTLFVIDVSQAVEHDHPHAFDFLRKDLGNVEEFFSRRGVRTLGLRSAFDFVTRDRDSLLSELDTRLNSSEAREANLRKEREVLSHWLSRTEAVGAEATEEQTKDGVSAHEDAVFMHSYIPRRLNEVFDPERDVDVLTRGEGKTLIYADTIGLVQPPAVAPNDSASRNGDEDKPSVRFAEEGAKNISFDSADASTQTVNGNAEDGHSEDVTEDGSDDEEEEGEDEDDADSGSKSGERKPRGHRHEDKEAKKERKKAVKEDARERRKHKMKKAEKKKKIKSTRYS